MAQMVSIQDKLLSNVSNGLFPKDFNYLCESLLPAIEVVEYSGKLAKYGNSHLRIEHDLMGGRAQARRVEPIVRTTSNYQLEHHGLEGIVTRADYANVIDPYDAEKDETLGVTSVILTGKEYALATSLRNTAIITQNDTLSGTDQWNDYANSNPLNVIRDGRADIKSTSGMVANTMVCPWEVANVLRYHPQILSQLGFAQNRAGALSDSDLAMAFGVKKFLVADAVYNSAKEGQTDSLASIWGKDVILAYIPDSAMAYQKSLGYYVREKGVGSRKVFKYDLNNPSGAKGILVEDNYQYLLSDVTCAYLAKSVIA